jgi:hypothetical protein
VVVDVVVGLINGAPCSLRCLRSVVGDGQRLAERPLGSRWGVDDGGFSGRRGSSRRRRGSPVATTFGLRLAGSRSPLGVDDGGVSGRRVSFLQRRRRRGSTGGRFPMTPQGGFTRRRTEPASLPTRRGFARASAGSRQRAVCQASGQFTRATRKPRRPVPDDATGRFYAATAATDGASLVAASSRLRRRFDDPAGRFTRRRTDLVAASSRLC